MKCFKITGLDKTTVALFWASVLACPLCPVLAQIQPERYLSASQIEVDAELQRAATRQAVAFSFIGAYEQALTTYELDQSIRKDAGEKETELNAEEKIRFQSYQPVNAVGGITKLAKDKRIVILNEAHHKPLHRVFAESLLDSLYGLGFRYLGLESLTPHFEDSLALGYDTLLNKRGYPLNSRTTGAYTREPQFAYFIRSAIAKGFYVFGYEATPFQKEEREVNEARNVLKIIKKDPAARILLFCGYAHLTEAITQDRLKNYGKTQWMASYIKAFSGIDPLTINQEMLTERRIFPNSAYYDLIKSAHPAILVNDEGKVFNGEEGTDKYDVLIYHPPTRYVHGRPDWLYRGGQFKPFFLNELHLAISGACLAKAWYKGESSLAVPADIIEVDAGAQKATLVLLPGIYDLEISNEAGDIRIFEIVVN